MHLFPDAAAVQKRQISTAVHDADNSRTRVGLKELEIEEGKQFVLSSLPFRPCNLLSQSISLNS